MPYNLITSSTPYKDFMKLALIIPSQENAPISRNNDIWQNEMKWNQDYVQNEKTRLHT